MKRFSVSVHVLFSHSNLDIGQGQDSTHESSTFLVEKRNHLMSAIYGELGHR